MLAKSAVSTCTLVAFAIHAAIGCCLHHAHTWKGDFGFGHASCHADHCHSQDAANNEGGDQNSDDHPHPRRDCDEGQCSYAQLDTSAFDLFGSSLATNIWGDVLEVAPGLDDGRPVFNLGVAVPAPSALKLRAILEIWRL